jgi:MYXO-CTERM domain-containing protein
MIPMTLHKTKIAAGLCRGIAVVALCAGPVLSSAGPIAPHYGWEFRGGEWGNPDGQTDNWNGQGGQYGQNGDNGDGNGNADDGPPGGDDQGSGGDNGDGDGSPPCDPPQPPAGVPEPATWALALAGLMGVFAARQRRTIARKIRG